MGNPDALSVKVSQFEVYNEQIYDLLAEEAGAVLGHRPALRLKEDSQGRIFVRDLSEVCLVSCKQACAFLQLYRATQDLLLDSCKRQLIMVL